MSPWKNLIGVLRKLTPNDQRITGPAASGWVQRPQGARLMRRLGVPAKTKGD